MTESQWLTATDPTPMLEFLRPNESHRKQRLFAVACCNRVRHLLVDDWSRNAIAVAERFADGAATELELESVRQDAWEFADHVVHDDEIFFDLDDAQLNAADVPAWTAEWSVEPVRVVVAAQRALGAAEGKVQTDLVLADALQDAGCDEPSVLAHCRCEQPHVRGCWVIDVLLGKE